VTAPSPRRTPPHAGADAALGDAIESLLATASATEIPPADVCLKLARAFQRAGDRGAACRWATRVVDAGDDFAAWRGAAAVVAACGDAPQARRRARVAVLGSYTTTQYAQLLRLAALRVGVALEVHDAPYGQYRQELLDPASGTRAFAPDLVVLATHEGELALPEMADDPGAAVAAELRRWTSLWDAAGEAGARVVQHTFAIPPETATGHLGAKLPGSRYAMSRALDARLGEAAAAAGPHVALLDCERLAGQFGKERWFDPRYWHLAKQAVALDALPLLARHTAALIAAQLGLSRKCLVLDLDNTLWGGIVGEDGLAGIRLGAGSPEGEAYVAFQEYVLALKRKGVVLAVCSKNNEADALEPFERHPEMRIRREDVAMFVANWETKSDCIRAIARGLDVGLDAIVFVDDNPAERQVVRELLPEVDVVPMPPDPAHYARALSRYLLFETSAFTAEDAARTAQYRARAEIATAEASAGSIEQFYRGLAMRARIAPFDAVDLPRIAQLVGKTNQFNLTTRRHGLPQLEAFARDPSCVHLSLRLRDRFADHGLVGVLIALGAGDSLEIESWLMSCRVIGRTADAAMLAALSRRALARGYRSLRGIYRPTPKSGLVRDLYAGFGFTPAGERDGATTWVYDLAARGPIESPYIELTEVGTETDDDRRQDGASAA